MIGAVAASLARRRLMDQRQRQRTRQRQHQQQRQRQRQRQRARQESRRRFEQQEQETTDHHMIQHSSTVRQQIRHVCSEVARNDDIERTDAQFISHVARLEADFFQMLIAEDVSESEEGGEENNGGDVGLDYHQSSELPNEMSVDEPSWRIRHDPDFDIPVAAVVPTASVVECSSRGTTNKSMQDRLQAIEETQMAERVNGTILIRAKKSRMCSIQ